MRDVILGLGAGLFVWFLLGIVLAVVICGFINPSDDDR